MTLLIWPHRIVTPIDTTAAMDTFCAHHHFQHFIATHLFYMYGFGTFNARLYVRL